MRAAWTDKKTAIELSVLYSKERLVVSANAQSIRNWPDTPSFTYAAAERTRRISRHINWRSIEGR